MSDTPTDDMPVSASGALRRTPSGRDQWSSVLNLGCCPECRSRDLSWHAGVENTGGVVDGRIRMHEVSPFFYLGCNECSETVKRVTGDVVAEMLTEMQADIPAREGGRTNTKPGGQIVLRSTRTKGGES